MLFFTFIFSCFIWSANESSTSHIETIVLGSGCFWGAEKGYEALDGVIDAVSGYADGEGVKPSYREITKFSNKFNPDNHAEVVEVTFNKNLISLEELIVHYLESHDPTQLNRQGPDVGTQYRSEIFYKDESQKKIAEKIKEEFNKKFNGKVVTNISEEKLYQPAEEYHQYYLKRKGIL